MKTKVFEGDLGVEPGQTLIVDYTEITGYVRVHHGATFQADQLTTIGGCVDVCDGTTYILKDAYQGTAKAREICREVSRSEVPCSGGFFRDNRYTTADGIFMIWIVHHRADIDCVRRKRSST